jgi:hypothetical protein
VTTAALPAIHLFATFGMTGLIWFVQIVHYPMLARHAGPGFARTEREHCNRTGMVAAPLMLLELATLALLLLAGWRQPALLASIPLLVLLWLSTFLLQVPCHRALLAGWNPVAHRRLVRSNWIRTSAWTARSLCVGLAFS